MKLEINSDVLNKCLSSIKGVIDANPTIPALENFLFEAAEDKLTVTASNMKSSISATMEADVHAPGKAAIPAKKLMDTLGNLPDHPLTFTVDEAKESVAIKSFNGRYKLTGESPDDFPRMEKPLENEFKIEIGSKALVLAIKATLFAASSEEVRPVLNGVYIHLGKEEATFVATDGSRLVRCRLPFVKAEKETGVVVHKKALTLLNAALPKENVKVTCRFSAYYAVFEFGNVKLTCRLIDDKYPKYENAIPESSPHSVLVERQELAKAFRCAIIYARTSTRQVGVKIDGDELLVFAEDADFGHKSLERHLYPHDGEPVETSFNGKLFAELLEHLPYDRVRLNYSVRNKPFLITPEEEDPDNGIEVLTLIMPMAKKD